MQARTIYVSWLPDVLYRLHKMAPTIPKCFSHWCQGVTAEIAAKHKAHRSQDGHIAHTDKSYIHGIRTGWAVAKPIIGDMLEVLQASGGGICAPENMLTRDLRDYYKSKNLFVSTYAYTDWQERTLNIDLTLITQRQSRLFDIDSLYLRTSLITRRNHRCLKSYFAAPEHDVIEVHERAYLCMDRGIIYHWREVMLASPSLPGMAYTALKPPPHINVRAPF